MPVPGRAGQVPAVFQTLRKGEQLFPSWGPNRSSSHPGQLRRLPDFPVSTPGARWEHVERPHTRVCGGGKASLQNAPLPHGNKVHFLPFRGRICSGSTSASPSQAARAAPCGSSCSLSKERDEALTTSASRAWAFRAVLFNEGGKLLLTRQGRLEQNCRAELCSPLLPLSPLKEHKFISGSSSAEVRGCCGSARPQINGPAVHPAHMGGSEGLGGSFQIKIDEKWRFALFSPIPATAFL